MVTLHHRARKVGYIQQIKVNETLIQILKWDVCDYVYTKSQSSCPPEEKQLDFFLFMTLNR